MAHRNHNSRTRANGLDATAVPVRLAHFPNVTHAPALVGVANGFFQKELGRTPLTVTVVAAGPEAMEAPPRGRD